MRRRGGTGGATTHIKVNDKRKKRTKHRILLAPCLSLAFLLLLSFPTHCSVLYYLQRHAGWKGTGGAFIHSFIHSFIHCRKKKSARPRGEIGSKTGGERERRPPISSPSARPFPPYHPIYTQPQATPLATRHSLSCSGPRPFPPFLKKQKKREPHTHPPPKIQQKERQMHQNGQFTHPHLRTLQPPLTLSF
jgi:hypothetical protein